MVKKKHAKKKVPQRLNEIIYSEADIYIPLRTINQQYIRHQRVLVTTLEDIKEIRSLVKKPFKGLKINFNVLAVILYEMKMRYDWLHRMDKS